MRGSLTKSAVLAILAAALLPAQCVLNFSLGSAAASRPFDNRTAACSGWTVEFTKTGTTATLTLQSADNIQGPWSTFTGTAAASAGPVTAIGSPAYVRVLRSSAGTGVVRGTLKGTAEPWVKKEPDGSVKIRTTLLPEHDLGTCTTAATVDPANGNRQKVTLTAAQTCVLTFTQPSGSTASVQVTVTQSSAGGFNGAISGGKWPGGTVPTITQTSGAQDVITCFLNGTDAKCVASQDFR